MTTSEGQAQISGLRGQMGELRGDMGDMRGQMGELRGEVNGLNRRVDDLNRLLMVLIGIAGGGLITAVTSLVLQLHEVTPYPSQSSNQSTMRDRYSSLIRGWPVRGNAWVLPGKRTNSTVLPSRFMATKYSSLWAMGQR